MNKRLLLVSSSLYILFFLPSYAHAQDVELDGSQNSSKNVGKSGTQTLGWGSSIEVGRNARAAEEDLKRGDAGAAVVAAERAANAAPRNARLWFLLGYASRLSGQYAKSVDAYQRGLKIERNNIDGLSGLAQTYQRMGRMDDARRLLMQVVSAAPRREDDLLLAGELFLNGGDVNQGIALLSRAESIRPSPRAEVMLAIGYLKAKQPQRAQAMLEQAKRHDPKNSSVFRAVANFYREQHNYSEAIAALRNAPVQNSEVLADLGYTYELSGDLPKAAETYGRAAKLDPGKIELQLSAAQAELRGGQLKQAREFLSRASQIDPNHYRLHALEAQLDHTEGHNADAIREYLTAIGKLPSRAVPEGQLYPIELRLNLAEIYREVGNEQAARGQMEDAEKLVNQLQIQGSARAEFLRVRASIRVDAKDFAEAEQDLKEAMRLEPANEAITLQYGNLLWREKRVDEARQIYSKILAGDAKNRDALEAMGYIARERNDPAEAERYFNQMAKDYPDDYVPQLALGDLYASIGKYDRANAAYEQAFQHAPNNALVIANAANAAIAAGHFDTAAAWVNRATGSLQEDPRVMRERERVLLHQGNYSESARLGYRVLTQLPNDRDASVYLAYDLYNLGRYDECLALTSRYTTQLPNEPNFPLLTGHIHKQNQLLQQAVQDYTEVLRRDPKMVEGYVNRGYVLNDLQNPDAAQSDFRTALALQPNDGVAHLGMAFSELQLHHGRAALEQSDAAAKLIGESGAIHLVNATAYRDLHLLNKAEQEYTAAIRYAPKDLRLQMALADTQYHAHHFPEAIKTLNAALAVSPDDPEIFARLASANAELHHRDEAVRYIAAAEKISPDSSAILLNTGTALLTLGDVGGAMQRFSRALDAPDADRVGGRLLIARVFVKQHKYETAQQQIALAFAESRVGEAPPVTSDNFLEAANLFLAMSDFDLARRYYERAGQAGAAQEIVAIGMANAALAQGRTEDAQEQLAKLGNPAEFADNFDYTMAQANIYRQEHQQFRAMTAFARATQLGAEDDTAEYAMQQVAGEQGVQVSRKVSMNSDLLVHAIIDDATILGLDSQIFHNAQGGALPPPRNEVETLWTSGYRADLGRMPVLSGFFQLRNAQGPYSLPSELLILNRDTTDYTFNSALNPILKIGSATLSFNTGLQFTVRRDSESPFYLNQNLFRQYVYLSTNSIGNWLAIQGEAFHETGPFTEQNLHSREMGARIQFIVGRPWGRTQFITSYSTRDLLFRPLIREFYSTSTSGGVQHEFGKKLRLAALATYIRSWRVQDLSYWIAQAASPEAEFEWKPTRRWSAYGDFVFTRGEGIHEYDNVQSTVFISYSKALRRTVSDNFGRVPVEYPIRFSVGVVNANYFNFEGHNQTILRPVVRLTLF